MIKSIAVERYRGIENLKIDNFEKYNFFLGDNGSSKTSFLEAIFLTNIFTYNTLLDIQKTRSLVGLTEETISNLVYNTDIEKPIIFTLNDELNFKIKIFKENNFDINTKNILYNLKVEEKDEIILDISMKYNNEIIFNKENKNKIKYWSEYFINNDYCWGSPLTKYEENVARDIKKFIEENKKKEILELINLFEKDIYDIASDGKEIKLSKKNIKYMMPLSSFGNGLWNILDTMTAFFKSNIKCIFIDEVETGIHYLNYPKFCKALVEFSEKKDVQLFITTHSKEFLEEFYKTIEKKDAGMSVYRFQKSKNSQKIKKTHYSKAEIKSSLKDGWDVR